MQESLSKTVKLLSKQDSYTGVCHQHYLGEPMPNIKKLEEVVNKCREILFPGYFGAITVHPNTIEYYMGVLVDEILELLTNQIQSGLCFSCTREKTNRYDHSERAKQIAVSFIEELPKIREQLTTDIDAAFKGDPASSGTAEVIFCYPAIRAISNYRIAHCLHKLGVPLIPRIISEMAHSETGIDIHPKAQIGNYFTIDHGTGVVIGSTAIIGNHVKLFQGVTLGAKSFPLDENGDPIKGIPRHPIVEDNVIIYSNATILGRITVGEGSIIGGNVWVTRNVEKNAKILQGSPRMTNFSDGAGI